MKKGFFLVLLSMFMMLIASVNATDFYQEYQFTYTGDIPEDVYTIGGVCNTVDCSDVSFGSKIEYFTLGAKECIEKTKQSSLTLAQMNACVAQYKISGNKLPKEGAILKYQYTISGGYSSERFLEYFSTKGDSYLTKYNIMDNFPTRYNDYNFYRTPIVLNFDKLKTVGVAEIGELNIINTNNPLKPVQVEVPVKISATVCSALRFSRPELAKVVYPVGYSDYNAETEIRLKISDYDSGTVLYTDKIIIPIKADTCASLGAFSWTPASSLLDKKVVFRAETEVIDKQIPNSLIDIAEVVETMFPQNLDGSCWTRSYDFMLKNTPDTALSTSIAQITKGEFLYAVFRAGAFRDEAVKPMTYEAIVMFDQQVVYTETFQTKSSSGIAGLEFHAINLTETIMNLDVGNHVVTLITRPIGAGCIRTADVRQDLNLDILAPSLFTATFRIIDEESNNLSGATINLGLIESDDYYVIMPDVNKSLTTDAQGKAVFTDLYRGKYRLRVSHPSYMDVVDIKRIGSDVSYTIKMYTHNRAPVVMLPDSITRNYKTEVRMDANKYIEDYNNLLEELEITVSIESGKATGSYDPATQELIFYSDEIGESVVKVVAKDPYDAEGFDTMKINFTDNKPPVIVEFSATPDQGMQPLTTMFTINVTDNDSEELECELDFGDGINVSGLCDELNGLFHLYENTGTFTAKLSATDNINEPVTAELNVFVYERPEFSPIINLFTVESSNGTYVPTNLTINWNATHAGNHPMSCSLRINGVATDVACIGNMNINNFVTVGVSRFVFVAIDNNSLQELRMIEKEFVEPQFLDSTNARLIIDSIIAPGEFEFKIEILNESLMKREIFVKPVIYCNGFNNTLSSDYSYRNGFLKSRATSYVGQTRLFAFTTDTRHFSAIVPTDVQCVFTAILTDDEGSYLELSEDVMFKYPIAIDDKEASIRGTGSDLTNFMTSTLLSGKIRRGYNLIEFSVVNNEKFAKKISVGMMSSVLGVSHTEEIGLQSKETVRVQIPLFIAKNVEPGMYPVRLTIRDDMDKQTKYSYIKVE